MFKGLPDVCYSTLESTGETILIKRGEEGYYPLKDGYDRFPAEEGNRRIEVTKAQAEAMKNGSMFGWETPSANPENYDENGRWKRGNDGK